ncbi:hypothetical protein JFL47_11340 [Haemophilus haemoglobinophilus]|nr:hypothetical protein [Canicola haemoglobinophilus]MBN6711807.1 hypothetical protein [Canicola haemoglobinophilus]
MIDVIKYKISETFTDISYLCGVIVKFFLDSQIFPFLILFLFLIFITCLIKISVFQIFKGIKWNYAVGVIFGFLSLTFQLYFYIKKENNDYGPFWLLVLGLFSSCILFILFSLRNKAMKNNPIKNSDYAAIVGILMLLQSALSMKISSGEYIFNVTITHGAIYIALPAFLIYEITDTSKTIQEISNKNDEIFKKTQEIYNQVILNKKDHKECKIRRLLNKFK